ncbi:IS1016 transposase [Neisseria canis]|uniref:IS1016 transposase n=1 Tax=Neisseria canis TaxID=493 RepID=A0A448D7I2_9NEIS|nr:IS1016 transposase [Neisseria canis]VEF00485.1 IS1016 transposase [Neisseria canis]VEF02554.1 IS1016 transposase [Neisseria canis]
MLDGEIEADESYFGGRRKGKRGRGAAGKVPVFGLLKRNGRVYTVAVPNTETITLLPIIREQVKPDSIVYTDCYKAMMYWMSANLTIFVSITAHILRTSKTT